MAKHCNDCLHYEVCRLLIGERELYIHDMACHFPESCCGYKKKDDYVKVVRCKDCRHLEITGCYGECKRGYMGIVKPWDFCSYGERREGE